MKIIFTGQLKQVTTKTLVSSDKSTQILIQADNLNSEIRHVLDDLQDAPRNESFELVFYISDEHDT